VKDFYTIHEAADTMGKSPQTVRRMIKKGDLDAQRIKTPQGFHYVVRRDAIVVPKRKKNVSQVAPPVEMIEVQMPTEEIVQKSVPLEVPVEMLDNSYVQNPPAPLVEAEKTVLTNQNEIPTSQNEVKPHKKADFEGLDMHHREKLGLFKIIDSLQAELDRERRKPRSLMAYFMEWLLS